MLSAKPVATDVTSTSIERAGAEWISRHKRSSVGGRSIVLSATTFECYSPAPLNSVRGTFVPKVLEIHKRRRRISIEIHAVDAFRHLDTDKTREDNFYEACIVRLLDPGNDTEKAAAIKRGRKKNRKSSDGITCASSDDADDMSVSPGYLDQASHDFASSHVNDGWKTKYRFPISSLHIKGTQKTSVTVEVNIQNKKEVREFIFDSLSDADHFCTIVHRELEKEAHRFEHKLKAEIGQLENVEGEAEIVFLIEIVSAWNIPIGDIDSCDPYVRVFLNGKKIHKTKHISKTLDPVWTVTDGSLFLLPTTVRNLFQGHGVEFVLFDYDSIGAHDELGQVVVPPKQLYDANGERMEFKIKPSTGTTKEVSGYMAIRCRRATDFDQHFMAELNKPEDHHDALGLKILHKFTESKGGSNAIQSIIQRKSRIVKKGPHTGQKEYKVRPTPDPNRVDETTWMRHEDLEKEYLRDSLNWIDTGSGDLGRIYLEILKCDNLPQMDIGGFAGNKTDAFVSIVFEDTLARTDIIDDCLSPIWLPWTKRAFMFHMYHSSSDLFIGVFDYDDSSVDDHDIIGRISVELSNLKKNTTYVLCYDLYTTSKLSNPPGNTSIYRKKMGTITFRLRIEVDDERKLLLSNLSMPPTMYVNVKDRKDFNVVRATCIGKYDLNDFDMNIIYSYRDEILDLRYMFLMMLDALTAVFLWQGTYEVKVGKKTFFLPIHSLAAFLMTTSLIERPELFPSYCFALAAWIMIASVEFRHRNAGAWNGCKSFIELFETLVLGYTTVPPDSIKPFQKYEAVQARMKVWEKRKEEFDELIAKTIQQLTEVDEEYEKELQEITTDTDITTKGSGGFSVDPRYALMKLVLHPVQQALGTLLTLIRQMKNIVTWQECYLSFWITIGFAMLSIINFFIPWFFLLRWFARLTVWSLLGPWMKLVDIYYFSQISNQMTVEQESEETKRLDKQSIAKKAALTEARILRENTLKLKAMKKYLFGKYIFRVNVLKDDRFIDVPRPESFALPYIDEVQNLSSLAMKDAGYHIIRIPGQNLEGEMIPTISLQSPTDVPIGQATSRLSLINTDGPGGAVLSRNESTTAAYVKLAQMVLAASVLTWFAVPLLAGFTQYGLKWASSS